MIIKRIKMKQITIGDKPLMQISQEDLLHIAVMQGCSPCHKYWNYPVVLEYDNTMFSDVVIISYQSTRINDERDESGIITFFFNVKDISFTIHKDRDSRIIDFLAGRRLNLDVIKFLIEKGYDVPIY